MSVISTSDSPFNLEKPLKDYNVCIYDYGSEVQIRYYKKSIQSKKVKPKLKGKSKTSQLLHDISTTGTMENFEKALRDIEENAERSKTSSANRAKNKVYEYARANEWEYFITLTFDPKKIDSTDYALVTKKLSKWLNNMKNTSAPDLKYIVVPELHKCGKKYHFHGLLSNVGNLKFVDGGSRDNANRTIYNMGNYKFGWSTATEISDPKKASNYISKYITKSLCEGLKGKKKYWVSRNLKKPTVTKLSLSEDEKNDLRLGFVSHVQHDTLVDVNVGNYKQSINYYELKIT